MALQDDDAAFGVPSQAHGANPELVLDRGGQWGEVLAGLGDGVRRIKVGKIVEQVSDPVGEGAHLLFLQRHAGQP